MLPHKFMMHLLPEYYVVNSSPQLRMESWKWPRRKKLAQGIEWLLCEKRQYILCIFGLGKRWSLITSWMVMGSWGKRLIIFPDDIRIRADEIISCMFKKGALHHPACGEVVQLMAMGYYRDQKNKWVRKLMGQIYRRWGHQFLFRMMFRMKPPAQKSLCHWWPEAGRQWKVTQHVHYFSCASLKLFLLTAFRV